MKKMMVKKLWSLYDEQDIKEKQSTLGNLASRMRRLFLFAMALLMGMAAMAQHHRDHPIERPAPAEQATLVLTASMGERFVVYVDGDRVNRNPQQQVVVDNLDYDVHDIYVVLTSPEDKITMISFRPINRREECRVHYDRHRKKVELLLPEQVAQMMQMPNPMDRPVVHQPEQHVVQHCSDHEVDQMVAALKSESFDSTREKLALNYAENHRLLAAHILRLAQEFDFDSNKKDFLKKAFCYCVDPENYAVVVSCLTFSSDKEELLEFMRHK